MARKKKPTKAEQEAQIAALQARLAELEGAEAVAAKPVTKKAGKDGKDVKEVEEKKPRAAPALEYVPLSCCSAFRSRCLKEVLPAVKVVKTRAALCDNGCA